MKNFKEAILYELMRGAKPAMLKETIEALDVDQLKDLFVSADVLQQQLGDMEDGTCPECDGEGCEMCEDTGEVDYEDKSGYEKPDSLDAAVRKPSGKGKKLKSMKNLIMLISADKKNGLMPAMKGDE